MPVKQRHITIFTHFQRPNPPLQAQFPSRIVCHCLQRMFRSQPAVADRLGRLQIQVPNELPVITLDHRVNACLM